LLNAALIELGLDIEADIYVTNIVRCRPPDNRKPTEDEIECCIEYLHQQLSIVAPKVIVTLGNTAIQTITGTTFGVTKTHGNFLKYRGIPVMPMFHPSAILRRGGKANTEYQTFKDDLQKAIDKLNELTAKKIDQ
jgi:DNA polymerase